MNINEDKEFLYWYCLYYTLIHKKAPKSLDKLDATAFEAALIKLNETEKE